MRRSLSNSLLSSPYIFIGFSYFCVPFIHSKNVRFCSIEIFINFNSVIYFLDNDIRENNTSDSCSDSEQDADQEDKWEPYKIDIDTAGGNTHIIDGD